MKTHPILKTREWVLTERQEEVRHLVKMTLEINPNITTLRQIADTTGAAIHEIDKVFQMVPELKAEFSVRRRSLANLAVDNIHEIVNNFNHPQNFQASKFIVQTYKNDLDEDLTPKISTEVGFDIKDGQISPVKITFSKKG
jgi:hypothetical protein